MSVSENSRPASGRMEDGRFSLTPGVKLEEAIRLSPLNAAETRTLLACALGLSRVQLITQSDRKLDADEAERVSALLRRRLAGEPVAYLIGEREFFGLPFTVTHDVLIPRPDTELLVELAMDRLPINGSIIDLGTGSGAIAVSLAHERTDADVTAVDKSEAALSVARANASRNLKDDAHISFIRSDWFSALPPDLRFDMVVSNPPYIAASDPHLAEGDLRFEPAEALTDHGDGLSAIRRIASGAISFLKQGGWLLMEHGYDQASTVRAMLREHGYGDVQSWRDLAGIERVTGGTRPAA